MHLLTRQQVIDIWSAQTQDMRNMPVCPNCRDILMKDDGYYFCNNAQCKQFMVHIPIKEGQESERD